MDSSKVEVVLDWKLPTILLEVRSFMGLSGYYQRFIKDFSKKTTPLTKLVIKSSIFV